jgi:hypothetical protein
VGKLLPAAAEYSLFFVCKRVHTSLFTLPGYSDRLLVVSEDPWYEIVDGGELEQGDFITNLPTFVPDYTSDILQKPFEQGVRERDIPGALYRYNVVVSKEIADSHRCFSSTL